MSKMSMRATFTTEFIYDGLDGFMERYAKMCDILGIAVEIKQRSMIGQVAGILKGSDLSESDIWRWFQDMCYDLEKVTKLSFRIVLLFEGGDILIKEIVPRDDLMNNE